MSLEIRTSLCQCARSRLVNPALLWILYQRHLIQPWNCSMMQHRVKVLLLLCMFRFAAFDVFFLPYLPVIGILISINISLMCSTGASKHRTLQWFSRPLPSPLRVGVLPHTRLQSLPTRSRTVYCANAVCVVLTPGQYVNWFKMALWWCVCVGSRADPVTAVSIVTWEREREWRMGVCGGE